MNVNLSKKDIIRLLRGVEIFDYKTVYNLKYLGLGDHIGGFIDSFQWNDVNSESWNKYSEEELYKLYQKLTEHNKNNENNN